MHAYNSHTASQLHKRQPGSTRLYMARSSYSVIATGISVSSLPRSITPLWCSVEERELSLVIYVQGKIFSNFINEIFSVEKFPNYST